VIVFFELPEGLTLSPKRTEPLVILVLSAAPIYGESTNLAVESLPHGPLDSIQEISRYAPLVYAALVQEHTRQITR